MSSTQVQITNLALIKVGSRTITAMTDSVKSAETATEIWDRIRDDVLRTHAWNWAQKQIVLTPISHLANAGFETADTGAEVFDAWTDGTGTIAQDTSVFFSGAASAKLTATAGPVQANIYSDAIVVDSDILYSLEIITKPDGNYAGQYGVYDVSNSAWITVATTLTTSDTGWTREHYSFTTPAGCQSIYIYLYSPNVASAFTYFDSLRLLPSGTDHEYVYGYPSDSLGVQQLNTMDTKYSVVRNFVDSRYQQGTNEQVIVTPHDLAEATYTKAPASSSTTTDFSASFVNVLATRLAAELAIPLKGSVAMHEKWMAEYVSLLAIASGGNANEGVEDQSYTDSWIKVRI